MKKFGILASFALGLFVQQAQAAVLAYEGFGNATDAEAINGYTPNGTASSGLTGSYTTSNSKVDLLNQSGTFVGISGGYSPNLDGANQQWAHHATSWDSTRSSIKLSNSLDLSTDGTYYMSFFAQLDAPTGNNAVVQMGFNDGTEELMWGQGYAGTATDGITAYHITIDDSNDNTAKTNADGIQFTAGAYDTQFYVAKMVKSDSGVTDKLDVNIKVYNLSDDSTIDNGDPATWLRTVSLTGVDNNFTHMQFSLDGGWGNSKGQYMDELRLGETWQDVTGVPEPSSLALFLTAAISGITLLSRRRKTR